jgi:hypothetical protein
MGLGSELEHADHFAAYVNELTKVLGHADRNLRDRRSRPAFAVRAGGNVCVQ